MGYLNTPAHHTAGAAWQAGDDVWPGPLVIRRANVYPPGDSMPGEELGDLGYAQAIASGIQAALEVGKTVYTLRRQQLDAQHERNRAATEAMVAERREAEAAKALKAAEAAQAAIAKTQAVTQAAVETEKARTTGKTVNTLVLAGAAVAALGLFLYMRKKK